MAVIVNNGTVNLSTANGFYRVEAHNINPFSATDLVLTSTRTVAMTFANAGNLKSIAVFLRTGTDTTDRSVQLVLQENVATVWTTRQTITLTASQIVNATRKLTEGVVVPFPLSPAYAVTTPANTWRFQISQTGGSTGVWSIRTSDATNPSYFAWCDNAVSFTSGDCLCIDESGVVTIDQTFTTSGVLGTGDSTNSVCGAMCRRTDPTNPYGLVWQNPPSASYTWTVDGYFIFSTHSGVQIGTSAARIPNAQQAIITIKRTPTVGGVAASGWTDTEGVANSQGTSSLSDCKKMSLMMYGDYPTYRYTTLNGDAASGQANITTTDSTGWATTEKIWVGKSTTQGTTDVTTDRTISVIAGTSITLSSNLTSLRKSGGTVVYGGGYGILFQCDSTSNRTINLRSPSNLNIDGVKVLDLLLFFAGSTTTASDETANISLFEIKNSLFIMTTSTGQVQRICPNQPGIEVFDNCFIRSGFANNQLATTATPKSGQWQFKRNRHLACGTALSVSAAAKLTTVTDNVYENGNTQQLNMYGVSPTYSNNTFWGTGGTVAALRAITLIDPTGVGSIDSNTFDNCALGFTFFTGGIILNTTMSNFSFGTQSANTTNANFESGAYIDCVASNFNALPDTTLLPEVLEGSGLRFVGYNATTNNDFVYTPYGYLTRCGDSLTDTTVRTSGTGKFSLKFTPTDPSSTLSWSQKIPTGNIQNLTMTISLWVKINNANYYSGTHTKPTLSVNYDNGTVVTSVATGSTSWQRISITFTPTTTFGQIQVTVSGSTDASLADRDFYVDDMDIAYPPGYSLNLGGLDLWANALPVSPTIATVPSTGSVWDVPLLNITTANSIGKQLKDYARNVIEI